jgi:hypothetical protein
MCSGLRTSEDNFIVAERQGRNLLSSVIFPSLTLMLLQCNFRRGSWILKGIRVAMIS